MSQWIVSLAFFLVGTCTLAQEPTSPAVPATPPAAPAAQFSAPKGAKVFFISPKEGSTVKKKVTVKFGVTGIKIRKAGEDAEDHLTGHHHLIIDGKPFAAGIPVPTDEKNLHFGKGQTETEITLEPGEHTLTMQFADGAHRSYGEQLSATVKVKVR